MEVKQKDMRGPYPLYKFINQEVLSTLQLEPVFQEA